MVARGIEISSSEEHRGEGMPRALVRSGSGRSKGQWCQNQPRKPSRPQKAMPTKSGGVTVRRKGGRAGYADKSESCAVDPGGAGLAAWDENRTLKDERVVSFVFPGKSQPFRR